MVKQKDYRKRRSKFSIRLRATVRKSRKHGKIENDMVPNLKKQDKRAEQNDFEVRINKNMAWATFTQKMIANDGTVTNTNRETRILERINGDWKIVYLGQQAMK